MLVGRRFVPIVWRLSLAKTDIILPKRERGEENGSGMPPRKRRTQRENGIELKSEVFREVSSLLKKSRKNITTWTQ
jgi:hypothetical protein